MPWKVVKANGGFNVVKKGSGEVVAHHPTQEKAAAQVRALYANYHGEDGQKYKKKNDAKSHRIRRAASRRVSVGKGKTVAGGGASDTRPGSY